MDSVAQISKLQKLYQIAQHAEMIHISRTLRQTEASQSIEFESSADIGRAEASELLNVCCELFLSCSRSPQPAAARQTQHVSALFFCLTLFTPHPPLCPHCNCRGNCRDAEELRDDCPAADRGRSLLMWGREREKGEGRK